MFLICVVFLDIAALRCYVDENSLHLRIQPNQ